MVWSFREIGTMRFLAISPPLRMASATSPPLPSPTPTRERLSPTTTRALKLNRRPPLTTLATRLMCTTFSFSSNPCGSIRSKATSRSLTLSEFQSTFAGAVRHRFDTAVVEKSVSIKNDAGYIFFFANFRQSQSDLFCAIDAITLLHCGQIVGQSRYGGESLSLIVGYHLRIYMFVAAKYANPRQRLGTDDLFAHARLPALPRAVFPFIRHLLFPTLYLPLAEPTALPALRLMNSSRYLMPLPL